MTTKEIRDLSPTEIETKLRELRAELLKLRLNKQAGQAEKPHMVREHRKDIARLETILHAKKKPTPPAARPAPATA